MLTTFLPPRPTCSNCVLDHFIHSHRANLLLPPHISSVDAASISICTCFLPPPPSCPVAEQPSTWTALLSAGRHRSSTLYYPSGGPKEFLAQAVPVLLLPVAPPCRPQPTPRSLLVPGLSCMGVPSSLCLSLSTSRPLPPPVVLDRRSSTLPVPSGGVALFLPHPLCIRLTLLDLFRAVSWCLLKS